MPQVPGRLDQRQRGAQGHLIGGQRVTGRLRLASEQNYKCTQFCPRRNRGLRHRRQRDKLRLEPGNRLPARDNHFDIVRRPD